MEERCLFYVTIKVLDMALQPLKAVAIGPLGRIYPYEAELYAVRAALNWLVSNPHRLVKRQYNLIHRFKVSRTGVKVLENQKHCCALGESDLDSESQRVHLISDGSKVTLAIKSKNW